MESSAYAHGDVSLLLSTFLLGDFDKMKRKYKDKHKHKDQEDYRPCPISTLSYRECESRQRCHCWFVFKKILLWYSWLLCRVCRCSYLTLSCSLENADFLESKTCYDLLEIRCVYFEFDTWHSPPKSWMPFMPWYSSKVIVIDARLSVRCLPSFTIFTIMLMTHFSRARALSPASV